MDAESGDGIAWQRVESHWLSEETQSEAEARHDNALAKWGEVKMCIAVALR